MRAMVDLNVILDIVQKRPAFFRESADACNALAARDCFISAHLVTTAFYLMRLHGTEAQNATVDFILENFTVVPCDRKLLAAARTLGFTDYEDAVVAASAQRAKCAYIITRNTGDFANSPVPALTPGEFLAL